MSPPRLSRRSLLLGVGGTSAAALVEGCGGATRARQPPLRPLDSTTQWWRTATILVKAEVDPTSRRIARRLVALVRDQGFDARLDHEHPTDGPQPLAEVLVHSRKIRKGMESLWLRIASIETTQRCRFDPFVQRLTCPAVALFDASNPTTETLWLAWVSLLSSRQLTAIAKASPPPPKSRSQPLAPSPFVNTIPPPSAKLQKRQIAIEGSSSAVGLAIDVLESHGYEAGVTPIHESRPCEIWVETNEPFLQCRFHYLYESESLVTLRDKFRPARDEVERALADLLGTWAFRRYTAHLAT